MWYSQNGYFGVVAVKEKVGYVEIKEEKSSDSNKKELSMKLENMSNQVPHVVDRLRRLPRKMMLLHGLDNVTEFVLHDLASKHCFDLNKAAYFIDNPDFNCFKGVVGISQADVHAIEDIWGNPTAFTEHMLTSPFNQHVRSFAYKSNKKNNESYQKVAEVLAQELGLMDYHFYSWDMKHDNHGFLVCEKNNHINNEIDDDTMIDGLSLLSFCPVH